MAPARAFSRIREVVRTSVAVKCSMTLLFIGFVSLFTALLLARVVGCRPVMWFPDTLNVLAIFGSFIVLVTQIRRGSSWEASPPCRAFTSGW